ncbi:uncharacterized protein ISCGN_001159 [Ixodes scapularis]
MSNNSCFIFLFHECWLWQGGYTPLHLASMFQKQHIIELLLHTYGADPNVRDHSGRKPAQYLNSSAQASKTSTNHKSFQQRKHLYAPSQLDPGLSTGLGPATSNAAPAGSNPKGVSRSQSFLSQTFRRATRPHVGLRASARPRIKSIFQ